MMDYLMVSSEDDFVIDNEICTKPPVLNLADDTNSEEESDQENNK